MRVNKKYLKKPIFSSAQPQILGLSVMKMAQETCISGSLGFMEVYFYQNFDIYVVYSDEITHFEKGNLVYIYFVYSYVYIILAK